MSREQILELVKEFYESGHNSKSRYPRFTPGLDQIHCSGKTYDEKELEYLVDSALQFWLTSGRYEKIFMAGLAIFLGAKYAISANSGTSANLLAMSTIATPNTEVITAATGFPTTISSIIQSGMIPSFVDVDLGTYNVNPDKIEEAITHNTSAIFLAHTMGFPFDVHRILEICEEHHLVLIEDNCDSLGAKVGNKYTGTFGLASTCSFYPAHHITTGEGGAVVTNEEQFKRIAQSYRDWGRDCWCNTGHDNTCGKRFSKKFGKLPYGYDHKYVYSHLGFNMKMTDMQAAIGVAQLEKLQMFIDIRQANFAKLYEIFKEYEDVFILPEYTQGTEPSPFGFVLTVKDGVPLNRLDFVNYLEKFKIQTRPIFAGNILKQPCMRNVKYKVYGSLDNSDKIMNDTFWIGVHPGITDEMIDYIKLKVGEYFK